MIRAGPVMTLDQEERSTQWDRREQAMWRQKPWCALVLLWFSKAYRLPLMKLVPCRHLWWRRRSPSPPCLSGRSCCWRNWTVSRRCRSDWWWCWGINFAPPGGDTNSSCEQALSGTLAFFEWTRQRLLIPEIPWWWWCHCSWSTTNKSRRASTGVPASAKQGSRCTKPPARRLAGRPPAESAEWCLGNIGTRNHQGAELDSSQTSSRATSVSLPLVSHSQSSLLKPQSGLSVGGFPFGQTTDANIDVSLKWHY